VDPTAATQFISLKELSSFSGQMLVASTFAEVFKRIIPDMDDWMNRILITASAVVVNFVATISQTMPIGGQAWVGLFMLCIINGFVIALASMKAIEFIAERKVREIARDLAASGVQVETTVSPDKKRVDPDKIEAAPLAPLSTTEKDAPKSPVISPHATPPARRTP
jgi:hypothetical protein